MSTRTSLRFFLFVAVLFAALGSACERDTQVAIGGGTAPEFVLAGSGKMSSLKILGPKAGATTATPSALIWQVTPAGGAAGGRSLDTLQRIQYGKLPDGYTQSYPETGAAPPLSEGVTYVVEIVTANSANASVPFTIQNGRAVNTEPASNHRNIPTH